MLSCRGTGGSVLKLYSRQRPTGHRPYHSKVRAFPFLATKEEAIDELSWHTSGFTGNKVLPTFLRRIFPNLTTLDALRPTRIQAAYLPTWLVDAQIQASVWLKKQKSDAEYAKDFVQVQFAHTDIPGYIFQPLSHLSLMTLEFAKAETVPWSDELRKHDGDDVVCLPFSLSPFKLVDAARSLSLSDATISHSFRFDPSSVQATMLAAYPVLIPIYIAQYNIRALVNGKFTKVSVTAFMEAGRNSNDRRRFLEGEHLQELYSLFGMDSSDLLISGKLSEQVKNFSNVRPMLGKHTTNTHRQHLQRWIDKALLGSPVLTKYREKYFGKTEPEAARAVDWEDIRIRPFTQEERWANLNWLTTEEHLFVLRTMLKVHESERGSAEQQQDGAPTAPSPEAQKVMQQIESVEKAREEKKPAWLAQYELQQRLLAEYPTVVEGRTQ